MQTMTVLAPIEREGKKTFWVRIGRAFENRDGSINVYLDALPVGGKLQLRDANERRGDSSGAENEDESGRSSR